MKGIILAGGNATRLRPLTKITSKQLLPVYNKPMIFYPIETLRQAGVTEILIIIAPQYAGQFLNLLGSGRDFGCKFTYEIQEEPRGLADAFIVGEQFISGEDVMLILGDNIFDEDFSSTVKEFKGGGHIFAKQVPDPQRYGVIEFDADNKVISIVEKPKEPKSNFAMVGLYILDSRASEFAKKVIPSARGEIEIADVINQYLSHGELKVSVLNGLYEDAGTFDSLIRANQYWANKVKSSATNN
ncbi:MAG: sugar phosphate nucleotidyltransferase [Candidatus Roizmanbacteria bacterium]